MQTKSVNDDQSPESPADDAASLTHKRSVAELAREHDRVLHAFLMSRLHDEHDAREVAQEAYVRLLNLAEPGAVSFLRAYLFKIASNLAVDRIKDRQSRTRRTATDVEVGAAAEPVDERSPDRLLLAAEDIAVVRRALFELSPKCRRAFMLHRFEGWNAQQIADHLDIQPRMVRRYVARASVYCRLRVDGLAPDVALAEAQENE